jgi:hypothetical protein
LLQCGCDPTIIANGGSTVFSLAESSPLMRQLLSPFDKAKTQQSLHLKPLPETNEGAFRPGTLTMLISETFDHPGAGSFIIDDAVSIESVLALLKLFASLPVEENQKPKKSTTLCSERSYFCDAKGFVRQLLYDCLGTLQRPSDCPDVTDVRIYPHMRFLNYKNPGTILAPHIDLCRVDSCFTTCNNLTAPSTSIGRPPGIVQRSTHTFILYLTDCERGGETCLLGDVTGAQRSVVLARVPPRRARLLIFPHATPHEGLQVMDVPKILLRGEIQMKRK